MITPLAVILPWLVLAVGCWIGFQLIRQNGRIMLRLESLEHQLVQFRSTSLGAIGEDRQE